jgi:hypothetical protein
VSARALEVGSRTGYILPMTNPAKRIVAPAGWLESLERSKAQIAAGQSVPLLPVLDRLRASAERLEAEQALSADEAAPAPER